MTADGSQRGLWESAELNQRAPKRPEAPRSPSLASELALAARSQRACGRGRRELRQWLRCCPPARRSS
eukprot:9672326-Lingulodinium_polyedra.AAC.1